MKRSLLYLMWLSLIVNASTVLGATPNFSRDGGLVISSAIPQVVDTSTSPMRLYFIRDNKILSSTSTDGRSWSEESGIRVATDTVPLLNISTINSCSLLPLTGGGYRMLYSVNTTPSVWQIVSATSADGLAWANDTGQRFTTTNGTYLSDPRLQLRTNNDWRAYFLTDVNGGNDLADRQVMTSLSTDQGLTWDTPALALAEAGQQLGLAVRTDNRVRLFLTQALTGSTTATTLVSALSNSTLGTSFSLESGVRFSTGSTSGVLAYPTIFRSTESFRYRMLYAFTVPGSTNSHVYTALTSTPVITGSSPNSAIRTNATTAITISGEIFGSTPTVTLRKSGQTDLSGTSVTRDSDQSMTATFATSGLALGAWDLILTNPDGVSDTLTGALNVTFRSGEVSITDNLVRISQGTVSQIAVEIFEAGHVNIGLYTLDGKLVNTIFDGDAILGTTTYTWDGKTATGNNVASGTYLVKVDGPKLNHVQKIVVIR